MRRGTRTGRQERIVGRAAVVAAVLAAAAMQQPVPSAAQQAAAAPAQGAPVAGDVMRVTIPGTTVAFELVYLPGGIFRMGSPPEEAGRHEDEWPVHEVAVSPFWMGRHEVTYDEYEIFRFLRLDSAAGAVPGEPFDVDAVSRPTPPYEDPAHGMGTRGHPAVGMTRRAALEYARWLSDKTGRLFRLPIEAEWEYACRAGGEGAFTFGDDPAALDDHAWSAANAAGAYHEVGRKAANRWGLYDLHGNVAEWVADGYSEKAYWTIDGGRLDPLAGYPPRGRGLVRGGSYLDEAARLRCAEHTPEDPRWKRRDPQIPRSRWWNTDAPHVGFRIVSPARPYSREEIRAYWQRVLDDPDPTGRDGARPLPSSGPSDRGEMR